MSQEKFLPHPLHDSLLVGDLGSIISLKGSEPRRRKLYSRSDGYVVVGIATGVSARPYIEKVHRLVAQTHIPNPLNLREVNHINHQKADNRAANLEWVSHAENIRKAHAFLGNWVTGEKVRKAVIATPVTGGPVIRWPSARAWALSTGNANRAANVCTAIRTGKASCGFYWAFDTQQYPAQDNTKEGVLEGSEAVGLGD